MKFSVITCVYNSEKSIEKNIRSVENQTFQNFEHIFIDGFSSDKTIAIIKKYQSKFPCKVKLFQFKPKGIANAMNKGIKKSQGEYIIHLHSDDSFFNEKILKNINNFIKHNNSPDLIYGKANFINTENGNSRIIPHRKIYHRIRFWLLLLTNYVPHQAAFIKKEMFDKWGMFDENFKNSMDYDLWLRFSKNKIDSKFIDEIICNFIVRKDTQSTIGKDNQEHLISQRKYIKNKLILFVLNNIDKLNKKRNVI